MDLPTQALNARRFRFNLMSIGVRRNEVESNIAYF